VTAPVNRGFYGGLSVAFSLGTSHKLEKGALIQQVTAVHVSVRHTETSVSTQIAALRRLLLGPREGEAGIWFEKVTQVCVFLFKFMASNLHSLILGSNTSRCGSS